MSRVSCGGATTSAAPHFIPEQGEWQTSDRDRTVHN